jgi:L-amino acid N-acyltransferase YncA
VQVIAEQVVAIMEEHNSVRIRKCRFRDMMKISKLYCNLPSHIKEVFHPFPFRKDKFFIYICWIVVTTNLFPIAKRIVPRASYFMLIAADDQLEGNILGFIYFSITQKEGGSTGYIANVGIITKEEAQGKGIGSKMYESVIQIARKNNISKFRVTVMERNIPSTEQVKKLGYVCKGYTEDDRWNNKRGANLMWELDLTQTTL